MTEPRGVEDRIQWFLDHNPSDTGMCAAHTWHSLGGDYGNPPAWGCSDANECVDKVKASGRYWTPSTWSGPPPRGAWVGYKYGSNGHACLSLGDGRIATTDPSGDPGGSGIEDLDYPNKWGASGWDVWTDQYAGVRFDVDGITHGDVYLSKLVYGQLDSDSVRRLQAHLNDHPLDGGSTLPITGNLLEQTAQETRLCREQHGFAAQIGDDYVSVDQLRHVIPFGTCGCTLIDDVTPTPPDPPDPADNQLGDVAWTEYSGKPPGSLEVTADAGYVRLDADTLDPPADGLELHMAYLNCDLAWSGNSDGHIRVKYVRDNGDATGYQDYCVTNGKDDFLITAQHWEAGEAGVGGRWWVNVGGGITKATVTTRYQKAAGVPYQIDTPNPQTSRSLMNTVLTVLAIILLVLAIVYVATAIG